MGYSYVYPPLSHSEAKSGAIDIPLPTSPPAQAPTQNKPQNSILPQINPQKEIKNFLDNIGNTFNFNGNSDLNSRPSKPIPQRVRKRPNQGQQRLQGQQKPQGQQRPQGQKRPIQGQQRRRGQANLPRRRMDPGRKNLLNRLKDMSLLGSEARETIIEAPEDMETNEDIAAHR